MSDDEFDDFSIDDDALNQIATIEKTADGGRQPGFPARTITAGPTAWSASRKMLAGKSPALQLRTVPLQGSSSSESGGLLVGSAVMGHQQERAGSKSLTANRNHPASINLGQQEQSSAETTGTQGRAPDAERGPAMNAIEVLSDDDIEFELCSPPPGNKTTKAVPRAAKSVKSNASSADAARIARANAIRSHLENSTGASNWLTIARDNRQNAAVDKSTPKQTNTRNVKVTEWDPERPQTQVIQTHLPFRPIAPKKTGKTWDRTAYSKSGQRVVKKAAAKKKGKKKKTGGSFWDDEASDGQDDDEDEEDEEDGFDQFPMPFIDPSECPDVEVTITILTVVFILLGK